MAEDQDKDGDNDFVDVMIARMMKSGMSREEAIEKVKDKEYNKKKMKNEEVLHIIEAKKRSAKKLVDAKRSYMKGYLDLEEAGMPSSVVAHKQKLAHMSDEEFADKFGHKSEEELRKMAWRHGYGAPGTRGHEHYVNRVMKGLEPEVEATMNMEQTKDPYAESDTAGLEKPIYGGGNESNKRMKRDKRSSVNRLGKSHRQDYKGPDMNFNTNPNLPMNPETEGPMGRLIRKLRSERDV